MSKDASIVTGKRSLFGFSVTMSGYADDGYARSIIDTKDGVYDEDLLYMIHEACQDAVTTLDVGANIGYMSVMIYKFAPDGKIYAFEPVASNVKLLEKNLHDNNADLATHVFPFGLGDKPLLGDASWDPDNRGSAFVSQGKHEHYPDSEKIEIKVLDDIVSEIGLPDADFIKVDIEGYELQFLKGAKEYLARSKPKVIMEANHWCLNALQGITMPEFLEEVLAIFPYVTAFQDGKTLNVREHQESFMHENIVFNRMMNLFCSYDIKEHELVVERYVSKAKKLAQKKDRLSEGIQFQLARKDGIINDLMAQNKALQADIEHLNNLPIKASAKELIKSAERSAKFRIAKAVWGEKHRYTASDAMKHCLQKDVKTLEDARQALDVINTDDAANIEKLLRQPSRARVAAYESLRRASHIPHKVKRTLEKK